MRYVKIMVGCWLTIILTAALHPAAVQAASNEVTIAIYGGSFSEMTKKCFVRPFEKAHDVKVNVVHGIGSENLARVRAEKNNPQVDVVYMDASHALQAQAEGLLDKLNPEKIPNLKELYPKAVVKADYIVAQLFAGCGLVYNTKYVKTPPRGWKDLWDPKYKGKIALSDITGVSGWMTLLMAARIHGGDLRNITPGFEAIKKLKDSVITFYSHADQLVSLLDQGEAWIAPWYHDRAAFTRNKGVPVDFVFPEEGAVAILPSVIIPKGCPNKDLAEKYINFLLAAEGQKCFAENMFEGPVNKNVKLDPALAARIPYGEKMVEAMVVPDYQYVGQQLGGWIERWNKEIAK